MFHVSPYAVRFGFGILLGIIILAACGSATPGAGTAATSAPAATATTAATATIAMIATTTISSTTSITGTVEPQSGDTVARPSNAGGPGEAVTMSGDPKRGAALFVTYCQECHGEQGRGGIKNDGSADGTVPPLNPIDETLVNKDPKMFAYNLDLFIQNGSTPEGSNPSLKMTAWGKTGELTQKQIADLIAYLISLNPSK